MTEPGDDFTLGLVVLSVFVPAVVALGYGIVRLQHRRHVRAWQPLQALVQGVVQPIVGGGAESRMRGTYRGFDLVASMVPQASTGSDDRYNHFSVSLLGIPGGDDWTLAFPRRLWPGAGDRTPCVEARDATLRARLEAAGVMQAVDGLGLLPAAPDPPVTYSARNRSLTLQCDAGTAWLPPAPHVVAMLEALVELARINARVNPPAG